MITLAICWKAIGFVILTFGGPTGLIALVYWAIDLAISDIKRKKILGWSIISLVVLGLLTILYIILASIMCG